MEYEIANQNTNILSDKIGLVTHLIDSGDYYFHTHSFMEVFYIIKGSIQHKVNDTTETLCAGDMYFLRPGDVHCFFRESHNTCVHRDIMFTAALWDKTLDYIDNNHLRLLCQTKPLKIQMSVDDIRYMEDLFSLLEFQSQNSAFHTSYLGIIGATLSRFILEKTSDKVSEIPKWILELIEKLKMPEHYSTSFTELVAPYDYNKSYMARCFKSYVGMTMTEFFVLCKLNYAALLLHSTPSSIAEIAKCAGFDNLSYFNRCFKRQFKCTPREYAKHTLAVSKQPNT